MKKERLETDTAIVTKPNRHKTPKMHLCVHMIIELIHRNDYNRLWYVNEMLYIQ